MNKHKSILIASLFIIYRFFCIKYVIANEADYKVDVHGTNSTNAQKIISQYGSDIENMVNDIKQGLKENDETLLESARIRNTHITKQ